RVARARGGRRVPLHAVGARMDAAGAVAVPAYATAGGAGGRMSRRVLQITACAFPPEIRVLKEARTFRDGGFESAVMCPPVKGRPAKEEWNGIRVFRPDVLHAANKPLDKILYQAAFISPSWRRGLP